MIHESRHGFRSEYQMVSSAFVKPSIASAMQIVRVVITRGSFVEDELGGFLVLSQPPPQGAVQVLPWRMLSSDREPSVPPKT